MTTTAAQNMPGVATTARPGAVTPYIAVADARRALDWYAEAFGARRRGDPIVMPDGRIGHAEIEVEGGLLMLSDAHPEIGVVAPQPDAGATVTIHAEVGDVDALAARAVGLGATVEREPGDNPYGRVAVLRDPFGHRWMLNTPPGRGPATAQARREGDLAYVSLWVPDADRAADFFAKVLGWEYAATGGGVTRQVAGQPTPHGILGGQRRSTLFLCIGVDDADAAVDRVRAAGGQADPPHREVYGVIADCTDDQGVAFALFELSGAGPRPGRERARQGDLGYVALEVADSARTRAFYAAVAGWRFSPGRIEDGWNVIDVAPMAGISGGHPEATTVPLYRVDDIDAAVARVRAAGGTATDPQRHPYGTTAGCVDDQGTRFQLGELD